MFAYVRSGPARKDGEHTDGGPVSTEAGEDRETKTGLSLSRDTTAHKRRNRTQDARGIESSWPDDTDSSFMSALEFICQRRMTHRAAGISGAYVNAAVRL